MSIRIPAATALAIALGACTAVEPATDVPKLTQESRSAATDLQKQLAGKLLAEIRANGAPAAIGVCKTIAPEIAAKVSRETGWRVTRVSLKTRNPVLGAPDAWEQQVLAAFDARAAAGDKPDALERAEVVTEPEGRYFRYMKALPVIQLCTNCHGTADAIHPGVKAQLAREYPHDRATGYRVGQLRGAISIKRPLD